MRLNQSFRKNSDDTTRKPGAAKIFLRRIRPWLMVGIFSSIVIWLGYIIFVSDYFDVKKLEITMDQQEYVAEYEVRETLQTLLHRSIFRVSVESIERQLKQAFPAVLQATVYKEVPDTLRVTISERSPLAQIQGFSGWYLIDDHFVVFSARSEEWSVPKLLQQDESQLRDYTLGQVVDEESVRSFVDLVRYDWSAVGLKLVDVRSIPYALEIKTAYDNGSLDGDITIVLPLENDAVSSLSILESLLRSANMPGKIVAEVDLRFQNPVLRYR